MRTALPAAVCCHELLQMLSKPIDTVSDLVYDKVQLDKQERAMQEQKSSLWMLIRERGLRFDWVAERMGISNAQLSRLLSGERRWKPEYRASLSQALDVPEAELFGDEEAA